MNNVSYGYRIEWYSNGNVASYSFYHGGIINSEIKEWYEDGSLSCHHDDSYRDENDDNIIGKITYWYKNPEWKTGKASIKSEEIIKYKGFNNRDRTLWDHNSKVLLEEVIRDGKVIKSTDNRQ